MSTATEPRRMTIAEHVGEALVAAREHAGLSRNELARRMGVADTTLLELERGTANPTLGRLERVFDGYGVELVVHVIDQDNRDIYPGRPHRVSPCYRDDPAQAELRDELGLTECPDALPDPDPPDAGQPAGEAADVIRDTGA